jgi:hypothetical protein
VCMEEMRNVYKNVVRKSDGRRSFGRSGRRCEDNIRLNL